MAGINLTLTILTLFLVAHGKCKSISLVEDEGKSDLEGAISQSTLHVSFFLAMVCLTAVVLVTMCWKSKNSASDSAQAKFCCCPCINSTQFLSEESVSTRTPLQHRNTNQSIVSSSSENQFRSPTIATAPVISAVCSNIGEYAYTDITNNPPTSNTRPYYDDVKIAPRRHGATNASYATPVDILTNAAVYDPVCPSKISPTYDAPLVTKSHPKKIVENYSTGYSTVFQTAGTYVPTEEQRTSGNYEFQNLKKHRYEKLTFFKETRVYWAPASTTSGLYSQLAAKKYREIPKDQIRFLEQIGSGNFAKIFNGLWSCEEECVQVAVKRLKDVASENDKVLFLQEAAIMGQFWHTNVISLHGVVTVDEPVSLQSVWDSTGRVAEWEGSALSFIKPTSFFQSYIVLEYMSNGDLLGYIKTFRLTQIKNQDQVQRQFLRFAHEIALGMAYLAKKRFVHRDLAARNILLDANMTCKIGDFGMARELMTSTYYKSTGGRIPVKWTAPEALTYQKYSTASDIWSYGMVLYEMWSLGTSPFHNDTAADVIQMLRTRKGYCQPPPAGTPRAIYKEMVLCWNPEPKQRPSFSQISDYFCQAEDYLLSWTEKDLSAFVDCSLLGKNSSNSQHMFLDLQRRYGVI